MLLSISCVVYGFRNRQLIGLVVRKSLVGLLESWFGGGTVRHTLVLFHNYLVLSTLSAV